MFRPLLCWLITSSLLFLWQYHRTQASKATMEFSVSREGRDGQIFHEATLNGLPYQSGESCGVGWKKLVVRAEDAESFETNCFAWYGGAAFGNITLARSRGRMDLELSPAVASIQIIGLEVSTNLHPIAHASLSLPTGRYKVGANFARFSVERTVEVTRNQTTRVAIAPEIAALNLSSEPDKAEFELQSTKLPEVSVKGSTPAMITDLPVGEYQLAIARGDYRKNLPVRLTGTKATNELKVEFRYAKLSITSEPRDATVSEGGKVFGRTPVAFDLQPGSYRFQIEKNGFFGTNVSLTLSENDSPTVSVSLASVSFVEAIDRARQQSSGLFADYDRALADVEKALFIKPGDETALQLKRTIEFTRHLQHAKQFLRNGELAQALVEADAALRLSANNADALALKSELDKAKRGAEQQQAKAEQTTAAARAEERRKHPEKVLREFTSRFSHHELFVNQSMRFAGSVDTVRAGILRALGRNPVWSIGRDEKPDADTVLLIANHSGFGSKQNATIVASQTADDEVTVCFKLFVFVLGDIQLTLKGLSEDSYKPKHPRFASPQMASVTERNLARDTQDFKKRLEEELR